MTHEIYCLDCETTGLDPLKNEVIELSIKRMSDGAQKTWFMRPKRTDSIDHGALRINHHNLDDLLHKTKEGKEKYKDQSETLVEIEEWLNEDGASFRNRVPMGQNVQFDVQFLRQLWATNDSSDTFPFGHHSLDTMQIQFAIDYAKDKNNMKDSYSLASLIKSAGIKNEKAHSADADVRATAELFLAQMSELAVVFKK